jgi:hypothetical protein
MCHMQALCPTEKDSEDSYDTDHVTAALFSECFSVQPTSNFYLIFFWLGTGSEDIKMSDACFWKAQFIDLCRSHMKWARQAFSGLFAGEEREGQGGWNVGGKACGMHGGRTKSRTLGLERLWVCCVAGDITREGEEGSCKLAACGCLGKSSNLMTFENKQVLLPPPLPWPSSSKSKDIILLLENTIKGGQVLRLIL